MQLTLFQWDLIAVGKGYRSLARFDFDDARSRFAGVLDAMPAHAEAAGRGMRDLRFWEDVFREIDGLDPDDAAPVLWARISGFPFGGFEGHQTLRLHLIRHLLALLLGEYAAAEGDLRALLAHLPENGRLHGYLGDALWVQGRADMAGAVYARALLLAPQEVAAGAMRNRQLLAVIEEHGPALAPVHGFLAGLLPLVELEKPPVTPEARIYELLRQAEQARRLGHHQAMVAARRALKNLAPAILQAYLEGLGA